MTAERSKGAPVERVLVLGGGSEIGRAIVHALGERGLRHVVLAGRDPAAMASPFAGVHAWRTDAVAWDALDPSGHEDLLAASVEMMGGIDLVVCAVGSLGHHSGLTVAPDVADHSIRTNFAGPAAVLLVAARALRDQGHGTIIVLSSVAAVRARRSNFVYGSAKAGLDAFAQGLGDSLADTDVRVHVIRPGFVKTKMTTGLDPAPFATTAEVVAAAVARAVDRGGSRIVWVPPLLGPMMAVLRNVPRSVWRRVAADR